MLEQTIKIKSYDVHPNGVVKISALQKYMQQIAREDSDSYGATYAKMREANMVFVITRLAVEFERPLRDEDIVTIRTINNRLEGASFVREFCFSPAASRSPRRRRCGRCWILKSARFSVPRRCRSQYRRSIFPSPASPCKNG